MSDNINREEIIEVLNLQQEDFETKKAYLLERINNNPQYALEQGYLEELCFVDRIIRGIHLFKKAIENNQDVIKFFKGVEYGLINDLLETSMPYVFYSNSITCAEKKLNELRDRCLKQKIKLTRSIIDHAERNLEQGEVSPENEKHN